MILEVIPDRTTKGTQSDLQKDFQWDCLLDSVYWGPYEKVCLENVLFRAPSKLKNEEKKSIREILLGEPKT